MAIEIKYSEKLAGSTLYANRTRLKCSWADLEILVLDNIKDAFRKILLAIVGNTPYTANPNIVDKFGFNTVYDVGYMPLRWRADFDKTIGIPTGNYIDYDGERFIEINVIPPAELMGICKSKKWLFNCLREMSLSAENEYRKYQPYRDIIQQMYNGTGYDNKKYLLTYTVPNTAWVKIKSVTLYELDDTEYNKNDIETDSSVIIKENKPTNKSALLLGLGLLALNM